MIYVIGEKRASTFLSEVDTDDDGCISPVEFYSYFVRLYNQEIGKGGGVVNAERKVKRQLAAYENKLNLEECGGHYV